MANIYVRSTTGNDTNDGLSWLTAKSSIVGAASIAVAGDNVFISQSHSEVLTSNTLLNITFAGTQSNPINIYCVNDSSEPPIALASTGSLENQGAAGNIYISGNIHLHGFGLASNTSGTTGGGIYMCNQNITVDNTSPRQVYENCKFTINTTSPGARIFIGRPSNVPAPEIVLNNPIFKYINSGQAISLTRGRLHINGGAIDPTGAKPLCLLEHTNLWQGTSARAEVNSMDLSNMDPNCTLGEFGSFSEVNYVFRNCRMPTGWTGNIAYGTPSVGQRVSAYNCDSGDTNYKMAIADYSGKINSETVVVKAGGATDGTTQLSWKLESNANAAFSVPLISDEILRAWPGTSIEDGDWIAGQSLTISVDILHDSLTALQNDEIWMEVQYMDESTSTLGTILSTRKGLLSSAVDVPSSVATWTTTGITNPNTQRLSVTITPEQKGLVSVKLCLAKPNTVVYADPKLLVA